MAAIVLDKSQSRSGVVYNYFDDDLTIRVASGVTLSSLTFNEAIYISGDDNRLEVAGRLLGGIALTLGDELSDFGSRLRVTSSGVLDGTAYGAILRGSGRVDNAGRILGDDVGLFLVADQDRPQVVVNSGTIRGDFDGIFAATFEGVSNDAPLTLVNTGTIAGQSYSLRSGTSADHVTNRGLMSGAIELGDGDDRFDDRGGRVREGGIDLGSGDDVMLPGSGAESASGGDGTDTLDFRSGSGIRVSLSDPSLNSGRAAGDSYDGFERILGSQRDADRITGDGDANILEGLGGRDALAGEGGDDILAGGARVDRLLGGEGSDAFLFRTRSEGGDRLLDWDGGGGDEVWIDASGFGGGLQAGDAVTDAQFAVQSSNAAQSDDVRFIYRTSDSTLWFDANGQASGGLTLVARLPDGSSIEASDIVLV